MYTYYIYLYCAVCVLIQVCVYSESTISMMECSTIVVTLINCLELYGVLLMPGCPTN